MFWLGYLAGALTIVAAIGCAGWVLSLKMLGSWLSLEPKRERRSRPQLRLV